PPMIRAIAASVLALGSFALLPESAQAQPYIPGNRPQYYNPYRPPISPYLDLLRGGLPAANYYLGVVPERERRNLQYGSVPLPFDLDRRYEAVDRVDADELAPTLPGTGHATAFMTTSPYFTGGGGVGVTSASAALGQNAGYAPRPSRRR